MHILFKWLYKVIRNAKPENSEIQISAIGRLFKRSAGDKSSSDWENIASD